MKKLRCCKKLFFHVESLVGTIMSVCVKFQRKKNDHIPVFWRLKVDIFRPTGRPSGLKISRFQKGFMFTFFMPNHCYWHRY